ncbi:MAG: hypothetical protein O2884_10630 [Chloroflexi bacterium]|nr:hypothetical protein [Chloroflexota bacterium]
MLRRSAIVVLFTLVTLAVAACGAGATATPALPELPSLTLEELFARTQAAMEGMNDYRASGSVEGLSDEGPQSGTTTREFAASGGFRYIMAATGDDPGYNELICIDGKAASREGIDEPWRDQRRTGGGVGCPTRDGGLRPPYSGDADKATLIGVTSLNGLPVYHVQFVSVNAPQKTPGPGKTATGEMTFTLDWYVDGDSFLVIHSGEHQTIPIVENQGVDGAPNLVTTLEQYVTMTFDYEYDVGVVIEWPEVLGE